MAGSDDTAALTAYLTRLTGQPVAADEPLQLRSVHRAALASWARGRSLPLRTGALNAGQAVSIHDLLGGPDTAPPSAAMPAAAPVRSVPSSSAPSPVSMAGIGIDIEDVAALPDASDYRAHPFFQDHFTPTEIAHCVRQPNVRASFCGTWAAKEAVAKSGALPTIPAQLNTIELARDAAGRPLFPGCTLSISHTATTAVAVCVAFAAAPAMLPDAPPSPPPAPPPPRPSYARALTAVLGLIVVVQACCLVFLVWR